MRAVGFGPPRPVAWHSKLQNQFFLPLSSSYMEVLLSWHNPAAAYPYMLINIIAYYCSRDISQASSTTGLVNLASSSQGVQLPLAVYRTSWLHHRWLAIM